MTRIGIAARDGAELGDESGTGFGICQFIKGLEVRVKNGIWGTSSINFTTGRTRAGAHTSAAFGGLWQSYQIKHQWDPCILPPPHLPGFLKDIACRV